MEARLEFSVGELFENFVSFKKKLNRNVAHYRRIGAMVQEIVHWAWGLE